MPLTVAMSTTTSAPGSKLLCTVLRPDDRTVGRTPAGKRIVIEPETVLARMGPRPDEPTVTLPLTDRTWTAPATFSTPTRADVVEISASPAAPTVMRPLVVETRHRPSHSTISTVPETVRRSASATVATRIEPLCDVTPTMPRRPESSTRPDRVPMTTSAPSGHLTSSESEGRLAWISTVPSAVSTAEPPRSTTTSVRGSAVTLTAPDTALIRRRNEAAAGGSTITGILASWGGADALGHDPGAHDAVVLDALSCAPTRPPGRR